MRKGFIQDFVPIFIELILFFVRKLVELNIPAFHIRSVRVHITTREIIVIPFQNSLIVQFS